mmetsp:Transcript_23984/g.36478  ORF Transcript_23984/g.36478 Transcript_23984/m.36478 type:complete len:95 (-) Transcript_23984:150-434(-)
MNVGADISQLFFQANNIFQDAAALYRLLVSVVLRQNYSPKKEQCSSEHVVQQSENDLIHQPSSTVQNIVLEFFIVKNHYFNSEIGIKYVERLQY